MKIVTGYNELCAAISRVTAVFCDKSLGEDLRTILFEIRDGVVSLCTINFEAGCKTVLPVQSCESATDGEIMCLSAKSLQNRLSGFSSLNITKVDSVTIETTETKGRILIKFEESAKDEKMPYADKYAKTTTYTVENTQEQKEQVVMLGLLHKQDSRTDGTVIKSTEINNYLDALLPILSKDAVDNTTNRITIDEEYVYAVPKTFVTLMANTLPATMQNIILRRTATQFLNSLCDISEELNVWQQLPDGATSDSLAVLLCIKAGETTAIIRVITAKMKFNIDSFKTLPTNGITVDKRYFTEVARRIQLAGRDVIVKFDCNADGNQEVIIESKDGIEYIPVIGKSGTGKFSFELTPDALLAHTMLHYKTDAEYLYMFADETDNKSMTFACSDSTQAWQTVVQNKPISEGGFGWNSQK